MSKRNLAFAAAISVTVIYALNHTIAKGVMPNYVPPFAFIFMRVWGAAILFWGISFFIPSQKIERRDYGRFLMAALLGMVINMLSFFKGLELSTPINSAVMITISPIVVVILSAIFLKEKVTIYKALGIGMALLGAMALVLFGAELRQDAPDIPLGNALFILNSVSYGAYIVTVKKLVAKYHPFVLMKWLFTLAVIINFPITIGDFLTVSWQEMPLWVYGVIVFVVIGTTFLTYMFNSFAMTELKASTIGAMIYVQPVMGIFIALISGKDTMTWIKGIAATLVLAGVYLASKRDKSHS